MAYISKEKDGGDLICNHPKVLRIWRFGGMSANPRNAMMVDFVALMLNDGTRKEWKNGLDDSAVVEAEKYLQELQ